MKKPRFRPGGCEIKMKNPGSGGGLYEIKMKKPRFRWGLVRNQDEKTPVQVGACKKSR